MRRKVIKIMNRNEKRKRGISEFHEFLKAGIRRNITLPLNLDNKKKLEKLISDIVETTVYNFNQKSNLKIYFDEELLNNQEEDFQELK